MYQNQVIKKHLEKLNKTGAHGAVPIPENNSKNFIEDKNLDNLKSQIKKREKRV